MLHFVVCGGGPTGCEFAGELSDFVSNDLAPRYGKELVSLIRVSLLQSGKTLLTQFEESLQNLALEDFRDRINVVFGARVTEVTEDEVILQNGDRIRYGILIWAAGNGTRPIVGRLVESATGEPRELAISKRRKVPVDAWLRAKGLDRVFALGDCAIMEGQPLPSTAQVAGQQGAFLGRKFCAFCVSARKCAGGFSVILTLDTRDLRVRWKGCCQRWTRAIWTGLGRRFCGIRGARKCIRFVSCRSGLWRISETTAQVSGRAS